MTLHLANVKYAHLAINLMQLATTVLSQNMLKQQFLQLQPFGHQQNVPQAKFITLHLINVKYVQPVM